MTNWSDLADKSVSDRHVRHLASRTLVPFERLADALACSQDELEFAEELWVDTSTVLTRLQGLTTTEKDWIESRLWADERGA